MVSARLGILYKCVVFLLLIVILNEYRISNELRKSILAEIQTFNSRLTELIQSNTFLDQKKNLEEAVLAYGATIAFTERSDSLENGKGGE